MTELGKWAKCLLAPHHTESPNHFQAEHTIAHSMMNREPYNTEQ